MTTGYEKNESAVKFSPNDVHTYFSQINPIAERIAKAIADTKTAYGVLWYTLNSDDQDEIVNETLIKPELTLHYVDSLTLKRSMSSSSLDGNFIKDAMYQLNINDGKGRKSRDDAKELRKLFTTTSNQQYYAYDGRSLGSFGLHRVAQKLLKDDALADAGYRDEHSAPFSYRTRSQINFHLEGATDEHLSKTKDKEFNTKIPRIISSSITSTPPPYAKTTVAATGQTSAVKKPKRLAPNKPPQLVTASAKNVEGNLRNDLLSVNVAMNTNAYSTSSSPIQHEDEESSSLIPRQSLLRDDEVILGKNTSTDEDDEHEYYNDGNHEQMEEVKLLDAHVSLKRGFEFLNNW